MTSPWSVLLAFSPAPQACLLPVSSLLQQAGMGCTGMHIGLARQSRVPVTTPRQQPAVVVSERACTSIQVEQTRRATIGQARGDHAQIWNGTPWVAYQTRPCTWGAARTQAQGYHPLGEACAASACLCLCAPSLRCAAAAEHTVTGIRRQQCCGTGAQSLGQQQCPATLMAPMEPCK